MNQEYLYVKWYDDVGDGQLEESCHSLFLSNHGLRDFLIDHIPQYADESLQLFNIHGRKSDWAGSPWWRELCIGMLPRDFDIDLFIHNDEILRYRTRLGRIVDRARDVVVDNSRRNASREVMHTPVWIPGNGFFVEYRMTLDQATAFKLKYEVVTEPDQGRFVRSYRWNNNPNVLQCLVRNRAIPISDNIVSNLP